MRLFRRTPALRPRSALAVVALFAHIVAATGAPLPTRRTSEKHQPVRYPCQDRPCGCATASACWAGDCCCFTLEQKVAWAEERGIEPPAHMRPLVEARKARPAAPKPPKAKPACCAERSRHAGRDRPDEAPTACEVDPPEPVPAAAPAVRWVVAAFAQKCRGEGFAGLLKLDLVVDSERPAPPAGSTSTGTIAVVSRAAPPTSQSPPIPPPRLA